jgi:hypothetical protein
MKGPFFMNNFSWTKALGFGVLLWLIMFAVVSALVGFGWYGSLFTQVIAAVVSGIAAYVLAAYVPMRSSSQAFGYGFLWVGIAVVLDAVISLQYQAGLLGSWTYWLGSALVLFAPWFHLGSEEQARLTA